MMMKREFLQISSSILNRPEEYVNVVIQYDETLAFGGTFEPAFILRIVSC